MRVYGDIRSGNCYKIHVLLSWLQQPFEWVHVDILAGESQTEAFRQKNPNGKIPVLELDDGRTLSESNAILNYLADGTRFLPNDAWQRARALQWQFFEQYSHEPYIAVARYIALYLGLPDERRAEYEAKQAGGNKALSVMNEHLSAHPFFVGSGPTVADIALYAYTHVAGDGGFDLSRYPAVAQWCARIEALPHHKTLAATTEEMAHGE